MFFTQLFFKPQTTNICVCTYNIFVQNNRLIYNALNVIYKTTHSLIDINIIEIKKSVFTVKFNNFSTTTIQVQTLISGKSGENKVSFVFMLVYIYITNYDAIVCLSFLESC